MTLKQDLDHWLVTHPDVAPAVIGFLIGTAGDEAIQRTLVYAKELERLLPSNIGFVVEPPQ